MKEAEYSREFDLIPVHFGRALVAQIQTRVNKGNTLMHY